MNHLNTLLLAIFVVLFSHSLEINATVSPNGKLKVAVLSMENKSYSDVEFSIEYMDKCVLSHSKLGLETDSRIYAGNLRLKSISEARLVVDDYKMITGKRRHCVNEANEQVYYFENDKQQEMEVIFRVYNDGIAFKYGLTTDTPEEYITNELTTYYIPQGTKRWMQRYDPGYEGFFPLSTDGFLEDGSVPDRWGYPALIELQDSLFVLLTEANIRRGNCGSLLYNGVDNCNYQVRLAEEKLPFYESWTSPWRLMIVGSLSDIVESTLVTDVSDPSKIEDTNWIKPGCVAWNYWAYNHGSRDYEIVKKYIDLAAEMKWPYDLIDWEWEMMENGGTVLDAVEYALKKKVTPLLWYNSSTNWIGEGAPGPLYRLNTKENREKEFKWLREIGVAGIKIDFFSGDGISTMNYYLDLLEDAMKYRLILNFHGATIPRGWQRTYPHMMSVEGVYGAEWYNNNSVLTNKAAAHNATLPFTRNVVGPMDYTPGTFSDSQHPHITSYGHEIALPILFESASQHMPDRPSIYYSFPTPIQNYLSQLPTVWDDTKLLAGYPGVEAVIARRKGDTWYIGGINGTDEERTLRFSLNSLSDLGTEAMIIRDGMDDRNLITEENVQLRKKEFTINCLPRGGFVLIVK